MSEDKIYKGPPYSMGLIRGFCIISLSAVLVPDRTMNLAQGSKLQKKISCLSRAPITFTRIHIRVPLGSQSLQVY